MLVNIDASFLFNAFQVAVDAALPAKRMRQSLDDKVLPWLSAVAPNARRCWVVGAGKAGASMACEVEHCLGSRYELAGLVLTRHGHAVPTHYVTVVEAGHPVPDEAGQRGAFDLMNMLRQIPADEPVLALISGGGSSLLSVPAEGITFEDLRNTNRALLTSGAPIGDMNVVRKHITQSLGGQLALATAAPVYCLILSDVPGDDAAIVASGPFVADDSTFQDALAIVSRWSMDLPAAVIEHLKRGAAGAVPETPDATHPRWSSVRHEIFASNRQSLDAVTDCLKQAGLPVLSLGDALEGEAAEVAAVQAAIVREALVGRGGWPATPFALISGGECTVTLPKGLQGARGGRNSEFLLSLIHHLHGVGNYAAIAGDTDGIDGSESNAGAYWLAGDTERFGMNRAETRAALVSHDAFGFFSEHSRLVHTGPTLTNVNDMRIIIVGAS